MNAPKVHHTQAVNPQGQQAGQHQQQVMEGHYGGYTYRAHRGEHGKTHESHHHQHLHHQHPTGGGRRAGGAPKKGGLRPRRAPKRRTNLHDADGDMEFDEHGSEMGGDHMDDGNRPFDEFKFMFMRDAAERDAQQGGGGMAGGGGGGPGGLQRGAAKAGSPKPKFKLPPLGARPEDSGSRAVQLKLPGAAELFSKGQRAPARGMDAVSASSKVVLSNMMRGAMSSGRLMIAANQELLTRDLQLPRLTVQDAKNLLTSVQRELGWTEATKLPQSTGDHPALEPVRVLNMARPRTDEMRKNAVNIDKALLKMRGM